MKPITPRPSSSLPLTVPRAAQAAWVALAIFIWLALLAWVRPLAVPDEGRYGSVAWAMLQSGDWLVPRLNGLPFFHKPPLFYWIDAQAFQMFGAHPLTVRLASLIGGTVGAYALWRFARAEAGAQVARWSLFALLAQPLWYSGAQYANLDMLVAGCITLTIVLLARAALAMERAQPHHAVLAAAWTAAAAGVLAKGLIGFVLPAGVIGLWLLARGRWRVLLRLFLTPGVLLFALIAAPWFVLMQREFPVFLHYFFVVQHFERFAEGGFNNAQPMWFFVAVLALGALPASAWLAPVFRRHYWRAQPHRQPLRLLMAIWLLLILVFFSIPQSKLVGYILPAVPPLAFLAADAAQMVCARAKARHFALAHAGALEAAPTLPGAHGATPTSPASAHVTGLTRLWHLSMAAGALLCLVLPWALGPYQPGSQRILAETLRKQRTPAEPVIFLHKYYHDIPLYAHLQHPPLVVDFWRQLQTEQRDNWQKEITDAAIFAPRTAQRVLIEPADLASRLCTLPSAWLAGPATTPKFYPLLNAVPLVSRNADTALWHWQRGAPGMRCP
ncbi:MAG: glycosyltransferase family 39 protein [Burkholderiaceae bacterium]|jgi:hypothetical protein|nr:glycosyltransferase family 39 protein [Burkholderiaceae bacterium]